MELLAADDMHVHLRDGEMMRLVTPMVQKGGAVRCLVMPNLVPPITSMSQVREYHGQLQKACNPSNTNNNENDNVTFLMTLYLHPTLTPALIREAKESGLVTGVKSYPKGVTTNSDSGIEDYALYYPVFEEMQRLGLILHLHGEVPSNAALNICVLNAEAAFLAHLERLNRDFPRLKIILEHATTAAAIATVRDKCSDTVACTITAHHLYLTIDDWAGQPHNYCKPVAKFPADRQALRDIIKSGHPRFFLGSDSAPHPLGRKESGCCPAGVFTSPYLLPYLAHIFEELDMMHRLEPFVAHFGADFYGIDRNTRTVRLERRPFVVPAFVGEKEQGDGDNGGGGDGAGCCVVPFLAGKTINYQLHNE